MRVALFSTCLVDAVSPSVGIAAVAVLERLGCRVEVPEAQTCCGQMHVNTGYPKIALPLIRRHANAFDGFDAVVGLGGSCVASVRHQQRGVAAAAGDHTLAERCAALAPKTYEFSEFLVDVLGVIDVGAYFPHRVTYHPACHSARSLGLGDRPLRLLRAVRGIDLVELPGAGGCCGFGGTFSMKNADVSSAMLADKIRGVLSTGAEQCVSVDSSCLMHIGGGLSRLNTGVGTMHLAEVLASQEVGE